MSEFFDVACLKVKRFRSVFSPVLKKYLTPVLIENLVFGVNSTVVFNPRSVNKVLFSGRYPFVPILIEGVSSKASSNFHIEYPAPVLAIC